MKDFPLIRSMGGAVAGGLLLILPMLLLSSTLAGGLYLAALLLFAGPVALCLAGAVCGALPMALGCAAALFSMGRVFGSQGLTLTAVYLLPVLAAFLVVLLRRVPFWTGCGIMIGTHLVSFVAVYLILQRWAGGDLYTAAGNLAMDTLNRWEYGDYALAEFYAMGLIGLPGSLADGVTMSASAFALSDAARQDLLLSVGSLVSSSLVSIVNGLIIVRQSILGGVGCLLLPLRFGYLAQEKRQARARPEGAGESSVEEPGQPVDFPDLGMPPFSCWYIPRKQGWMAGAALVLGVLLQGSALPAAAVAGLILYYAGEAAFAIQGAAMINFSQHVRKTSRFWRVLVPLLLISTSLLMVVGIFDQIVNIRGLRKPPEPKEEF